MQQSKEDLPGADQYIVAIGASAGGLEAIQEFFDHMPANGHLSFVIIQHLSPDYKSLLVELLSKHTHMQVQEAAHNIPVQKNSVYVIPNNKLLIIKDGRLQLIAKNAPKTPNQAIDTFLSSLAADQGSKAIAVILSGTGTDGSRSIQAIQERGGIVLVQDPLSAKFDGMPNAAIATGFTDAILPPELMPEEIYAFINEQPVKTIKNGQPYEEMLPEVLQLVEQHCHYDFHNYKTPTILRRIGRRMGMLGYNQFDDYIQLLRTSSEECRFLGKEFLIGVTKFFRDPAALQILKEEVLPGIIRNKQQGDELKIWIAACSTGEEAYTLAIIIDDLLRRLNKNLTVKIFASDIDAQAVEVAAKGTYAASSVAEIEEHLVKRYFNKEGNLVTVNSRLRKQIVFARHNILKDPPFINNDMVSCRNMLIYMNSILQKKVLATLQFALHKGGILFLGPSEVPASVKSNFEEISSKWKIYRKVTSAGYFDTERYSATSNNTKPKLSVAPSPKKETEVAQQLSGEFTRLLVEEYHFTAIFIDQHYIIKEAVGDFRKYLTLPDRITNLNILKMVDEEVALALSTAIRKADRENTKVALGNIKLSRKEASKAVNIYVKPSASIGYIMIVLGSMEQTATNQLPNLPLASIPSPAHSYLADLEEELRETRINLQHTVESLETANEELQSSNEELLSANEELQSGNEELQSLNEELHTLNTEHQLRIKELIELNDDLNNYFRSSEIAQIFVDAHYRIRKFNPTAIEMINLIETDIGRPIDHISTNLKHSENFYADIQYVLATGEVAEKEVYLRNDHTCLMKILPYERQNKKRDGVVITFIDITRIRQLNNIIKGVFNASLSALVALKSVKNSKEEVTGFEWMAGNYAIESLLQKKSIELEGKEVSTILPFLVSKDYFGQLIQVLHSGQPYRTEVQLSFAGKEEWYDVVATQMNTGVVVSLFNIEEKKQAEEAFKSNYQELLKVKESYRNLNTALEEKVQERTNELAQTEERFRLIANTTSDVIWDWDIVTNSIWWSDSFYSLFGFEKKAEKLKADFWMERLHPDDKQRVTKSLYEAINNSSKAWNARFRLLKKDGTYATILNKGTVLLTPEGTPYRMVGSMVDITESERSQEQLEEKNEELKKLIQEFTFVTDFMPQMVWATQPDGYHDFYNKQWYDYTGLTFEQTKGPGWNLVVHPDDQEKAWSIWRHSLATGEPYEVEYRFKRYDGLYRWFLGRALPLKDDQGVIIKWFGTCTDIHDQKTESDLLEIKVKERTEELQRTNIELEASNQELMQFASVASHDLKEPLRKIHMFSNIIKDRYLETSKANTLDYLNRIIKASSRMTSLVNDLLAFTCLSGETYFVIKDLNEIVSEVISDLELSIADKKAVIEVEDLPEAEVMPAQMRQVFQNLLSNALKFSKADIAPCITISAQTVDSLSFEASATDSGAYCQIIIQDNGIGFNEQLTEKIFVIFQRLHAKEVYEGTGIGLAITKKIVERHNGLITAKSKEGEGATFIMILPLKQDPQQKRKIEQLQSDLSHRIAPLRN